MASEHKEVQVARITARQAILVALITALSGIFLGILTTRQVERSNSKDPRQRWLTIKPLVVEGDPEGIAVRVVVLVNSQAYSYPSRAVWADIDSGMSRESFPLPAGAEEYRIRFEIFVRRLDDRVIQFTSQDVHVIEVVKMSGSDDRVYPVYPLDEHFTRGPSRAEGLNLELAVSYEVR